MTELNSNGKFERLFADHKKTYNVLFDSPLFVGL
jgi:hypothetical protein